MTEVEILRKRVELMERRLEIAAIRLELEKKSRRLDKVAWGLLAVYIVLTFWPIR